MRKLILTENDNYRNEDKYQSSIEYIEDAHGNRYSIKDLGLEKRVNDLYTPQELNNILSTLDPAINKFFSSGITLNEPVTHTIPINVDGESLRAVFDARMGKFGSAEVKNPTRKMSTQNLDSYSNTGINLDYIFIGSATPGADFPHASWPTGKLSPNTSTFTGESGSITNIYYGLFQQVVWNKQHCIQIILGQGGEFLYRFRMFDLLTEWKNISGGVGAGKWSTRENIDGSLGFYYNA